MCTDESFIKNLGLNEAWLYQFSRKTCVQLENFVFLDVATSFIETAIKSSAPYVFHWSLWLGSCPSVGDLNATPISLLVVFLYVDTATSNFEIYRPDEFRKPLQKIGGLKKAHVQFVTSLIYLTRSMLWISIGSLF